MGPALSRNQVDFEVVVKTGDVKGAGTDANVYCALIDEKGSRSRDILLDCIGRNDFEKGSRDVFKISNVPNINTVHTIELWRDSKGIADDWFLDYVLIRKVRGGKNSVQNTCDSKAPIQCFDDQLGQVFPFNRWIKSNMKYVLLKYDSILPQFDPRIDQRKNELQDKKAAYIYVEKLTGLPRQVKACPAEESFSNDYKWDIVGRKLKLLALAKWTEITTGVWDSLDDLVGVYKGPFEIPRGYNEWKSDVSFGNQRLAGCNANLLRLCESLPKNFAVTSDMVEPFLDGLKLHEAIARKEIYIVNHRILKGLVCAGNRIICAPLALFHAKKNGDLLPIAIQLFQEPAEDNPVFLPSDPVYTWMLAKMYFNNADASVHQTCTHLGFTHLIAETLSIAVHRELSPSHPVYRLLAPHFLYLIAINDRAVGKLLAPGGWIDITMTMGTAGLNSILKTEWKAWRMDRDGWLPADLKARGVDSVEHLPRYPYRDDALLLHEAIYNYVAEVLRGVYDTPDKLKDDYEVQALWKGLTDEVNGSGVKGIFGNGGFSDLEDLIKTVTSIIFISSVGHAAANFVQYDEYAFPPNYPAMLRGEIPRTKAPLTEKDIVDHLPDKETSLSIMVVTKILSDRGTNKLGDFEVQYQYDPNAVAAVKRFQQALLEISKKVRERNQARGDPYAYLDPEEVPNAISI